MALLCELLRWPRGVRLLKPYNWRQGGFRAHWG